jgi:subtilisin family serine protease
MRTVLPVLATLGAVTANTERYVIHYDEVAWNTLSLRMLPTNTVSILKNLRMQIADLEVDEMREFATIPGVTLYKDHEVHILDEDVSVKFVEENPPNWGIDRIDQRQLPLDKKYHYDNTAADVDVYIVDTGINIAHDEFEGRAVWDKNTSGDHKDEDCNGHGTHVASTIGGKTVGVAKGAKIHAVKVLQCNGSGSMSGVVKGIEYVVEQHIKAAGGKKTVFNMSLGGGQSPALNAATTAAVKAGVVAVVAAGNDNADACNYSPASTPEAITVAASTVEDEQAYFSNWGKCVDIYAPGHNIKAAWIGGKKEYKTISGTSMASPHVAGAAALVLGSGVAKTPADVKKHLVSIGTKSAITNAHKDTPNVLLYTLEN